MRNEKWFELGGEIARRLKKSVRLCPSDGDESPSFEVIGGNATDIRKLRSAKIIGTKVLVDLRAPGLKLKAIRA